MYQTILTLFFTLWFSAGSFAYAYESLGNPSGYVNDFAQVLSSEEKTLLESELQAFAASTTNEIAVVTVPSIGDDYIENYAVRLFEEWKIGTSKNDNGVLLLLAVADRQLRIEVGYGLEGALPDSVADRIIRTDMVPLLKEERYADAVRAGVSSIVRATQGEYSAESSEFSSALLEAFMPLVIFILIALQWLFAILARTKSWWLGGILGLALGAGVSTFFGWWLMIGVLLTSGLTLFGLFFDYVVSSTYRHSKSNNIEPPWWAGGNSGGGWSSGGGGFGGFGGGSSGGGGASGRW